MDGLLVIPAAEGPTNRARWNAEETEMAPAITITLVEYRTALEVDRRTTLTALLTAKRQAADLQSSTPAVNPPTTSSHVSSTTSAMGPSSVMTPRTGTILTMPESRRGNSEAIPVLEEDNFLVKVMVEYNDHEMISNLETRFKDAIPTRVRGEMIDVIGPPALSINLKAMDATESGSQMTMWYFMYYELVFSDVTNHLASESSILASLQIVFGPHSGNHMRTRANIIRDLGQLRDMPAGGVAVLGLESGNASLPAGFELDELIDSMEQPA